MIAAFSGALGLGCKPKSTCKPDDFKVQVLIHPGHPLSMDPEDEKKSLSVNVHMFQLANRDPLAGLDLEALRADAKAALGEAFVAEERFTVWPGTDDLLVVTPKPQTRHILLVAEFRRIIGVGWYLAYDLPAREEHEAAVCTAVKHKKPPIANPCFYAMLERYEMRGGGPEAPAGMPEQIKIRNKPVQCAPPFYEIDPKVRKQRARRKPPRLPGIPGLPLPAIPRAPPVPSAFPPSPSVPH